MMSPPLFDKKEKVRTDIYDKDRAEKLQKEAYQRLINETEEFFFKTLEEKFSEVRGKYPEAKEVIVYIKTFYDDTFEMWTEPVTERAVHKNTAATGIRDMAFRATNAPAEHSIEAMSFVPDWKGWTFPFKRTY